MQKTYHPQTGKFLAMIAQNMPEISADVMQGWIENPKGLKKVLVDTFCPPEPSSSKGETISIVRNRFNPTKFLGQGWSIIGEETDTRSVALVELDLAKVQQVTMLKDGETYVKGEEKLKRLKASDYIRLDADIFLTLWENQHLIPESWKEKVNGNTRYIFFDGTVLRRSDCDRYVLCLTWRDGAWHWDVIWLDRGWRDYNPSAVLAS